MHLSARKLLMVAIAAMLIALTACENNSEVAVDPEPESDGWTFHERTIPIPSLKDVFQDDFEFGFGIDYDVLDRYENLLAKHAYGLTPGNSMKPDFVQQVRGNFTFDRADQLMQFAEQHGMSVHGHTLVWHNQSPSWMTRDKEGNPLSREEALRNMREHIHAVVGYYKGRVKEWDVVNEAISDGAGSVLRADSPWLKAIGEDYIKYAFQYAHEADPDAILYYNDYNIEEPGKRARTIQMLKSLIEDGVPIHGVGIQGHWGLSYPPYSDIRNAIEAYAELGLKVQITELDVSMYAHNDETSYPEPPEELLYKQAERYQKLFDIFRDNRDAIARVSTWGIADDDTWLDNFPVRNRKNWPLLFDEQHRPKESFWRIVQEPVLSKVTVESGYLMSPFEHGKLDYLVKASEGATEVTFMPVAMDENVTVTALDGEVTESGVVVQLKGGRTEVTIRAEGYGKTHDYKFYIIDKLDSFGWEFDEGSGTEAADYSILGNHAALFDAEWTKGVDGGSALLLKDGPDSYADLGAGGSGWFSDADFSVSLWFKADEPDKNQTLLWYGQKSGLASSLWRLKLTDQGAVYFQVQRPVSKVDSLGSQFLTTEASMLNDGDWNHIVAVRKGEELQIFVNGELAASRSYGYVVDLSGTVEPLLAGTDKDGQGHDFAGALDSVHVYNYAIGQEEAKALYQAVKGNGK